MFYDARENRMTFVHPYRNSITFWTSLCQQVSTDCWQFQIQLFQSLFCSYVRIDVRGRDVRRREACANSHVWRANYVCPRVTRSHEVSTSVTLSKPEFPVYIRTSSSETNAFRTWPNRDFPEIIFKNLDPARDLVFFSNSLLLLQSIFHEDCVTIFTKNHCCVGLSDSFIFCLFDSRSKWSSTT